MNYIKGTPREQLVMFQECLDNIIDEENPIRFIEEYVEKLDLKKLGFKEKNCTDGRPPYRNQVLLKVYIYGYLNRQRSSRRRRYLL